MAADDSTDPERPDPATADPATGGDVPSPEPGRVEKARARIAEEQEKMEKRPLVGFAITSVKRFLEIDGQDLTLIISTNLFVAVIPMFILLYSLAVAFNPKRSIANVMISRFDLSGDTAQYVTRTFPAASSGKNLAIIISIVSLFVTGFGVAAAVQNAYARAYRMHPLQGVKKYSRGALWFLLLIVTFGVNLTVRDFVKGHSYWWILLAVPILFGVQFIFYLVTPRMVLDLPFEWKDLRPGATVSVVVNWVVSFVSVFFLRYWLSAYGQAYGPFGVGLAILSWIGITAAFWVWIAAVSAVYWERYAGATAVAAMEDFSDAQLAQEPGKGPDRSKWRP